MKQKQRRIRTDDLPSAVRALRTYHANNVMTVETFKHLLQLGIERIQLSPEDQQKYAEFRSKTGCSR